MRNALLLLTLVLVTRPVAGQDVQLAAHPDGTVSFAVRDIPLGQVLRSIDRIRPFENLVVSPEAAARPVTLSVENLPLMTALIRLLRAAEVDFVVAGPGRVTATFAGKGSEALPSADGQSVARSIAGSPVDRESTATPLEPTAADVEQAATSQRDLQQLQQILSVPRLSPAPGALIELPFPNDDGSPRFSTVPSAGTPAVFFPNSPAPQPQGTAKPQPAPAAAPTREQQSLVDTLVPNPR